MIKIVGLGPGNPELLTLSAVNALVEAEVLAGAPRNMESAIEVLKSVDMEEKLKEMETIYLEKDLNGFIKKVGGNQEKKTVVVVSGDPGFYSLLDTFQKEGLPVSAVPGISSYQYFYSRLGLSYKNHRLLSCHGRETDFIEILKSCEGVFLLTDGETTPEKICRKLEQEGFENVRVHIGANLSYENEEIVSGRPKEFLERDFSLLSSVIIEKR